MNANIARFQQRSQRFSALLDQASDQWDAPTPCEGWNVGDVVAHVIATERDFLALRSLDLGPEPDTSDLAAAFREHISHTLGLLGDEVAGTEYDGWFGPTTIGATMADFYGWDLVIHGWDVARATGQPWHLDDPEVQALGKTADGWGAALYSEGVCGPQVELDAEASAQDRLLARLGRDPSWNPEVSATE